MAKGGMARVKSQTTASAPGRKRSATASAPGLEAVFDALPWPVVVFDDAEKVTWANSATAALFGLDPLDLELEQLVRVGCERHGMRHVGGQAVGADGLLVRRALAGEAPPPATLVLRNAAGSWVMMEASAVPLRSGDAIVGAAVTWKDVGESTRHVEEALKSTTLRLESLLENSPLAVIEWASADYQIIRWSDEATRVFGWTAAETVGKRIDELDWVHPDDAHLVQDVMADMLSGKRPRTVNANRNLRKDGTVIHCEWYNSTLRGPSGSFSVLSLVLDVTDRRRAEAAARVAHENFVDAVESLEDGFVALDREFRFTYANRRAAANVGREPKELIGHNLWELFPSLAGTRHEAAYRRVMAQRVPEIIEVRGAVALGSFRLGIYPAANGLSVVFTDITERQKAEEALRASEATVRGILNAATESIWLFTVEGVALVGNRTALSRVGGPPGALLGHNIAEFLPEEVARSRQARLNEVAESGQPLEFEDTRAGMRFEHTCYPVLGEDGRVARVAIFSRDVTTRRSADAALRRYELLASHSRDIVLFMRLDDGRILEANAAAQSAYGYSREELLTLSVRHLRAPDTRSSLAEQLARAGTGDLLFETVHQRRDGSTFPVEVSARGATIDGARTIISVVRDVTERKRAEEALREANRQLAEADHRKDEFLAMLSHELRNPLAPIRNSAYVLERAAPGGEQARRALAVIDRQAAQLSHLVDDLLDVTRITRQKIQLRLEPLDLALVARKTLEDQRSLFEQAGVALELELPDGPVMVTADSSRLAQVLGNLLQNAVKFTPPGGVTRVTLELDAIARRAVLRVTDTGEGMSPELLARLFQPFSQADSSLDRSRGGLGLGLALVKGLVELHGGDVTAHSAGPGRGAELRVRLPLSTTEATVATPGAVSAVTRRRVLVIEDNVDAAQSLRDVLELAEHEVAVVHSGPDGLEKAREFRPDVVLCDIGLPGMDGYQVARAFRADEALKASRLVALSGYALPEDVQHALQAGFEAHLAKPPSLERLVELLGQGSSARARSRGLS